MFGSDGSTMAASQGNDTQQPIAEPSAEVLDLQARRNRA